MGIYLYCVAEGEPLGAAPKGVDEVREVYSLTHGDLAAVVSPVGLAEFGQEVIEEKLQSLEWVEAKVIIHSRVVDWAMERCPVLPMRFATIFHSEERIRGLLSERYEDFKSALAHLRGTEEWGVKLHARPEAFFRARLAREVEAGQREMAAKSRGQAYLLGKRLEQSLRERCQCLLAETAEGVHRRLAGKAVDSCMNEAMAGSNPGERTLLNAAYLVKKDRRDEFLTEAKAIQDDLAGSGMRLCPSGPWPSYNFSQVDLREDG